MMKYLSVMIISLMLAANAAFAGDTTDRVVDSILGGLGGALIGGPVGLVAGAATGATAGPAISHAWGLEGNSSATKRRSSSVRQTSTKKTTASSAKPKIQPAVDDEI